MKLDQFNRTILGMLVENSKRKISEISKKIKRSKAFVSYRIKALEKMGVIKRRVVALKLKNLGYMAFRIVATGLGEVEKIKKVFGVRYVARFYDGYDIGIVSKDGLNLQYLVNLLKNMDYNVSLLYRGKVYVPFNLFGYQMKQLKAKEDLTSHEDKIFWKVVNLIEKGKNLVEISRMLGLSYSKVRSLVRSWEGNIIRGYSIVVDLSKFGIKRYIMYVRTTDKEELIKIATREKVNYVEKVSGYYDFRIEFFGNYKRLYRKISKISKEIFLREVMALY